MPSFAPTLTRVFGRGFRELRSWVVRVSMDINPYEVTGHQSLRIHCWGFPQRGRLPRLQGCLVSLDQLFQLLQPVAPTSDVQDHTLVQQTIQDRRLAS